MNEQLANILGAAARAARTRAGLTQAEVAELLGLATEVYGRLERGAMLPSVETLVRISSSLGVPPNQLLGLGGPEEKGAELPDARRDSPELRRLLRRVEGLDRRKLRLLSLIAAEMGRQQAKAARLRGERPPP